jgi:hypothetical protein
MRRILYFFTFVFLFIFFSKQAYAELKFTEVYPAPEKNNYEWVEIYNDGSSPIDTSAYSIFDLTGNNLTFQNLIIEPQEYSIATSSSVINNSGDSLFLKNNSGVVVHTVTTPRDITWQQSYILCGSDWKITDKISQKNSNESACIQPTPTRIISPTPSIVPISPVNQSETHILISEALVYPEKNKQEWVELFNNSDEEAQLNDWLIDDIPAGSTAYKFSVTIQPHSYKIINLPSSIFNNDADEIRLLDNFNNVIDSLSYSESQQNFSLIKFGANPEATCITEPTPEIKNNSCVGDETTVNTIEETPILTNYEKDIPILSPSLLPVTRSHIFTPLVSPSQPTPRYIGKTYSLEKLPDPPFMTYTRLGLFCSLLSCTLNFMYSMYRYKKICASLFTIGSQHLPG